MDDSWQWGHMRGSIFAFTSRWWNNPPSSVQHWHFTLREWANDMMDNSGLLMVVHYVHLKKSGNQGPACALLLRQNIVQNYCNKSSFCYLCWHRVVVVTPWTTTKYPCGFDGQKGWEGFFFSTETASHQTLNHLVNETEDKNIHFDQKRSWKHNLVLYTMGNSWIRASNWTYSS